MKTTWLAPIMLALAVTPALASDTDTDDGQMQNDSPGEQQNTPSNPSDTEAGTAGKDHEERMTRQSDDMKLEAADHDRTNASRGDMRLEGDTDT